MPVKSSPLSRRKFLTLAGGAAGAVAVAPLLSSCDASPPAGPSAYSTPLSSDWADLTSITLVPGVVLAAAKGTHLRQRAGTTGTIELIHSDSVVGSFGTSSDPTRLNFALDATFAPDGTIWVIDRGNQAILHFDATLKPIATHTAVGDTKLRSPSGIEALSDGRLVVTDSRSGVHVVSPSTQSTGTLRSTRIATVTDVDLSSTRSPTLFVPREIAVGPDDTIIVHDRSNGSRPRLLSYSSDGSQVAEPVPLEGTVTSLAVTPRGNLVTVDSSTQTFTVAKSADGRPRWINLPPPNGTPQWRIIMGGEPWGIPQDGADVGGISNSSSKRFWIGSSAVDRQTGELLFGNPAMSQTVHLDSNTNFAHAATASVAHS